jgi:hypothetical protein
MREVLVQYRGTKKFVFKNPAISAPIDLRQEGAKVWIPYGDYTWFLKYSPTMFELIDERYSSAPRKVETPDFDEMTIKDLVEYAEDYLKQKISVAGLLKSDIVELVKGLWEEKVKGEKSESEPEVLGGSVEEEDQAGLSIDEPQETGVSDPEDTAETSLREDDDT